MVITEFGDALIKSYREVERDFAALAERRFRRFVATVVRDSIKVSVRAKLE